MAEPALPQKPETNAGHSAAPISAAVTSQRRSATGISTNPIAASARIAGTGPSLTSLATAAKAGGWPSKSEKRNGARHYSARPTDSGEHRGSQPWHPSCIHARRRVRFHSEIVLLGIARHFRSHFSHPNLELRVILNPWKTPLPLQLSLSTTRILKRKSRKATRLCWSISGRRGAGRAK